MLLSDILQERFARQNEIKNVLGNQDITFGFECEGVAFSRAYYSIVDSFMEDENFSDIEGKEYPFLSGTPIDFQDLISDAVEESEGYNTRCSIASKIEKMLQVKCVAYDEAYIAGVAYDEAHVADTGHGRNFMDYSKWGVLGDGSVKGEGVPVEIVSSPYDLKTGLGKLQSLLKFMYETNISSNETTGLHVTLGIKGKTSGDFDFLKLAVLYDESNTAKIFNRVGNEFCKLVRDKLGKEIGSDFSKVVSNNRVIEDVISLLKKEGDLIRSMFGKEKYFTIRPKDNGLFEFRVMGGHDYESRFNEIKKEILNIANLLVIASNEKLYAKEYITKIFQLLNNNKFDQTKGVDSEADKIRKEIKGFITKKASPSSAEERNIKYKVMKSKIGNQFTKNDDVDTMIRNIISSTTSQGRLTP